MIERVNHAQVINKLNETRELIKKYPEADYTYNEAFHSVLMEKINELIDKVNELEARSPIIISSPNYYPPYTAPYYIGDPIPNNPLYHLDSAPIYKWKNDLYCQHDMH